MGFEISFDCQFRCRTLILHRRESVEANVNLKMTDTKVVHSYLGRCSPIKNGEAIVHEKVLSVTAVCK